MRLAAGALIGLLVAAIAAAPGHAVERLVELPASRPGAVQRVLVDVPERPVGSVVLLAGATGDLKLSATGAIGGLSQNQLVRTRAAYAAAGYAVAVPDIALDLKGTQDYRGAPGHGRDLAAVIAHMRAIRGPVALIATSRGALSAANVMLKQTDALPDALVITSGVLLGPTSTAEAQGDPAGIKVPVLLVAHADDTCRFTPPAGIATYGARLTASPKVETMTLSGGVGLRGEACGASSPHGYLGMDDQVVAAVVGWLKANMR